MNEIIIFLKEISQFFKKRDIVFVGIGNQYKSDDYFGIEAIKRLKSLSFQAFTENDNLDEILLDIIKNKNHKLVVFIDASDFDGIPGEMKTFTWKEIKDETNSHKIPIILYMKLLENAGIKTYLISVQPEALEDTAMPVLCKTTTDSLEKFINLIKEFFSDT